MSRTIKRNLCIYGELLAFGIIKKMESRTDYIIKIYQKGDEMIFLCNNRVITNVDNFINNILPSVNMHKHEVQYIIDNIPNMSWFDSWFKNLGYKMLLEWDMLSTVIEYSDLALIYYMENILTSNSTVIHHVLKSTDHFDKYFIDLVKKGVEKISHDSTHINSSIEKRNVFDLAESLVKKNPLLAGKLICLHKKIDKLIKNTYPEHYENKFNKKFYTEFKKIADKLDIKEFKCKEFKILVSIDNNLVFDTMNNICNRENVDLTYSDYLPLFNNKNKAFSEYKNKHREIYTLIEEINIIKKDLDKIKDTFNNITAESKIYELKNLKYRYEVKCERINTANKELVKLKNNVIKEMKK